MWYCYILRNKLEQFKNNTYNGFTNNPMRRVRQHNEEIKGGARATHGKGGGWEICAMIGGFDDKINALSCEWRIKCPSGRPGKRERKYQGVEGRVRSLNEIVQLNKWTGKCAIENKDCNFKLFVIRDVAHFLDIEKIPSNYVVEIVDEITAEQCEL